MTETTTTPPAQNPKLRIELWAIRKLRPYEFNSHTHSGDQVQAIAASIRRFGFNAPLLIQADGTIIAGHGRLAAARVLRMARVPCIVLGHLTPDEARAYLIADNKLQELSEWDLGMLTQEVQALNAIGAEATGLDCVGFSEEDLAAMLEPPPPAEIKQRGTDRIITYTLFFAGEEQLARFHRFLATLEASQPGNTIAARLDAFLVDHLAE